MPGRRLIEGARDNLSPNGPLHLGDFFGTLIYQQHDEVALRLVSDDRGCYVLQQHRLSGLGRRNDQSTLPFADGSDHIDNPGRQVFRATVSLLELQSLGREERCQILKEDLILRIFGPVMVYFAHLEHGEISLPVLGWANQAGNRIPGSQVESSDLAR